MIKLEKAEVFNFEGAIRGMRNPMNSWDKSDSGLKIMNEDDYELGYEPNYEFIIGENDLKLMKNLIKAGSEHRKFLRQIFVSVDITAPLYWWSEFDTYKVGTVANSTSKMHKLLHKPFEMNDFSFDKVFGYKNEVKQFRPIVYEDEEEWKNIQEGYMVSSCGRIKNPQGRILGCSLHQDGYIFVTIKGKQYPVHRLVAKTFIPNEKNKPFVNHIDANKQNNFINNLEWVTQKENIKHARENNLQPNIKNTYKGKFTEEERNKIKEEYNENKISKRQLAKNYNVSHTCISDIINEKYKYVEDVNIFKEVAQPTVDVLNELRDSYINSSDEKTKKQIWYSILQLLPNSYNQRRTVTLNYEVLLTIYKQRKNHKLDEWRTFCDWIKELPYAELITNIQ